MNRQAAFRPVEPVFLFRAMWAKFRTDLRRVVLKKEVRKFGFQSFGAFGHWFKRQIWIGLIRAAGLLLNCGLRLDRLQQTSPVLYNNDGQASSNKLANQYAVSEIRDSNVQLPKPLLDRQGHLHYPLCSCFLFRGRGQISPSPHNNLWAGKGAT